MFIQTESTPNPATLKFLPGQTVLDMGTADFPTADAADKSPLASRIFGVDGVSGVFFGTDFVTVTKSDAVAWDHIKPALLGAIMEHFQSGQPVMAGDHTPVSGHAEHTGEDGAIVNQIKELLDSRVRPAVAQDGGDITFHGFDRGVVYLHMQGACAGCPSSTLTLKMGIENLLRHYIPEVTEVRPVAPDTPLVLAFDTSAAHCAAALLSGTTILASAEETMSKGQAERLMGLCADLLTASGITYRDLTAIGVGIGPGNFTGIRISVSAARGLALGLGIPAIGVTAFDALRFGTQGSCACAIDARRGQVYFQARADAQPTLENAMALPAHDGPLLGASGLPPAHPAAIAIAYLAASRLGSPQPRPAPLYLRPADAAPARDAPPVILS